MGPYWECEKCGRYYRKDLERFLTPHTNKDDVIKNKGKA
jgi:hypothetical protein